MIRDMLHQLRLLHADFWNDGGIGLVFLALLVVCEAFLAFMAVAAVVWVIDYVGTETASGPGTVCGKHHEAGHYVYDWNAATKTAMPRWVPPEWKVCTDVHGLGEAWMSGGKRFYDLVSYGDRVIATYQVGRLSGDLPVVQLERIDG